MKKLIFLILFLTGITSNAQQHYTGFHAGVSFTNTFSDSWFSNTKIKTGYQLGLDYQLRLFNNKFIIEPKVELMNHGFLHPISFTDNLGQLIATLDQKYVFHHLTIPLTLGYKLGDKFSATPKVGMGYSILLNAKNIPNYPEGLNSVVGSSDITDQLHSTEINWMAALEFAYEHNEVEYFLVSDYRQMIRTAKFDEFNLHNGIKNYGVRFSFGARARIGKNKERPDQPIDL